MDGRHVVVAGDEDPGFVTEVSGQRSQQLRILGVSELQLRKCDGLTAAAFQLGGDALVEVGVDDEDRFSRTRQAALLMPSTASHHCCASRIWRSVTP
jgi:hypothetical protein